MTELRELADGRADLLAEVTGIFEGASDGELDEPLARQAAQLCRAGVARMRPHSGQPRRAQPYARRCVAGWS